VSTTSNIDDPAYWRRRAIEARRVADQLDEATAKQTMLSIAQSYERLAILAETKAARRPT
jgi:hypothetical protein